jgi:hypothetical protein
MSASKRPKGVCKEVYRKMAKTKQVTINGKDFTLQSADMDWYLDQCDRYGITGSGRRNTSGYWDVLFRNCVIDPPEVMTKGIKYFIDDMALGFKLHNEIESFLTE